MLGCQTTGDPRAGGLFGWSEKKAKARKQKLRYGADSAQLAVEKAATQSDQLTTTRNNQLARNEKLQRSFNTLLQENRNLQTELLALKNTSRLNEAKLKRLNKEYRSNEQFLRNFELQINNDGFNTSLADELNKQNNRLHQELLFWLQQ